MRDALQQRTWNYEIVLVDDASSDDTAGVARHALARDVKHLTVVRHDRRRGYGITVLDGLRVSQGHILGFIDGDGQFDTAELGHLIDRLGRADLVAGYRWKRADPWRRTLVSGVFNVLVRLFYGIQRRDVDCGLKVMKRSVFTAVAPIRSTTALMNTELFFKAERLGFHIEQVAVRHLPRTAGIAKGARLLPILRAARDLVALRWALARDWEPDAPPRPPRRPATRERLWLLGPALIFIALRLPSFWEPHWYTDEAGYVSTAQSLLHGHVLYSQIWTNKPPLALWTIALVVRFFGPGEAPLHILTALSGLLTIGAIFYAARHTLGTARAVIASLIAAVALGLPVLDAELALPESLLIAPITWAGAIIAVHLQGSRVLPRVWPILAGALVAAALAYQQSALAETLAFGIAMVIAPRVDTRHALVFIATVAALTAAWLLSVIAMAGAGTVAFALAGFYIGLTQSVITGDASAGLRHFAEAIIAGLLFTGGALLRRRSSRVTWFFTLWAGATLMVAAVAGQPYAHYLIPSVAPVALATASLRVSLAHRGVGTRLRAAMRLAPQLAGVGVAAAMASIAGLDWMPSLTPSPLLNGQPVNATRNLSVYYGGALATATQSQSRLDWDQQFDWRVLGDAAAAGYIKQAGLSRVPAVIWSSDAWLYPLADLDDLMPTPPIYNDEVLLGINGQVATYVANLNPTVIVTSTDALQEFPEIQPVLSAHYVQAFWSAPDAVWVRADTAEQLP